jgi:ATP phosphoribosyltransferase
MLRIAIPKGSLEERTFKLFEQSGLPIVRSDSRSYNLFINDPRISEALLLRPQEIPKYVEEKEFELGITGLDWIVETESAVKEVADLQFSKRGWGNVKIILAADASNPISNPADIPVGSRIVTEYNNITRRYFTTLNKKKVSIRPSHGVTEVKVPRLADYLVDVTETGETLRRNGKKILAVILKSSTKLITYNAAWDDPIKRKAIEEIATLLRSAMEAQGRVLLKMNVSEEKLESVVKAIPSLRAPSVSRLFIPDAREKWFALEVVVSKKELNIIIPKIKDLGASDILEIDVSKVVLGGAT